MMAEHESTEILAGVCEGRDKADVTFISTTVPNDVTCHTHTLTPVHIAASSDASGFLSDIEKLSVRKLRKRYSAEWNNHRNMLQRRRTERATVHPDFVSFPNFLRIMGLQPFPKATIDRINNDDPEYAPRKVRWASKSVQNNNKSDSHQFHHDGVTYTTAELSEKLEVPQDTIRQRKRRKWTDVEIIAGHRHKPANAGKHTSCKDLKVFSGSEASQFKTADRFPNYSEHGLKKRYKIPPGVDSRNALWFYHKVTGMYPEALNGKADFYCSREELAQGMRDIVFGPECVATDEDIIPQKRYDRKFAVWWKSFGGLLDDDEVPQWAHDTIARLRLPKPKLSAWEQQLLGQLKASL